MGQFVRFDSQHGEYRIVRTGDADRVDEAGVPAGEVEQRLHRGGNPAAELGDTV